MFRNSRALNLAVFTGWVGAIVFFIMGLTETIRAGDYLSRVASATAAMPERTMPIATATGPAMFVLHGFIFTVCLGALFYLLALGSRMYSVHPTSTVTGLAFLSVPITLMAIHEAWLAF